MPGKQLVSSNKLTSGCLPLKISMAMMLYMLKVVDGSPKLKRIARDGQSCFAHNKFGDPDHMEHSY